MADKKALHITPESKNATFVDCYIEGAKLEGTGTTMISTRIFQFRNNHPTIWKTFLITLATGLIIGIILIIIEYGVFQN